MQWGAMFSGDHWFGTHHIPPVAYLQLSYAAWRVVRWSKGCPWSSWRWVASLVAQEETRWTFPQHVGRKTAWNWHARRVVMCSLQRPAGKNGRCRTLRDWEVAQLVTTTGDFGNIHTWSPSHYIQIYWYFPRKYFFLISYLEFFFEKF